MSGAAFMMLCGGIGLVASLCIVIRLIWVGKIKTAFYGAAAVATGYGCLRFASGPDIWSFLAIELVIAGVLGCATLAYQERYRHLAVFAFPLVCFALTYFRVAPTPVALIGEVTVLFAPLLMTIAVVTAAGAFLAPEGKPDREQS